MIAALLLAASQATISLPPGYYTLNDLCQRLTQAEKLPVVASPDCATDLFVANLTNCRPDDLLSALKATGRLTIAKPTNGYLLSLNQEHKKEMDQLYAAQVDQALDTVRKIYPLEVREITRLRHKPQDEIDLVVSQYQSNGADDAIDNKIGNDIYNYFEGELPFLTIAFTAVVAQNANGEIPTTFFTTNMHDNPLLFFPDGDYVKNTFDLQGFKNLPVEQKEQLFTIVKFGGKFLFDPVKSTLGFHMAVDNGTSPVTISIAPNMSILASSKSPFGQTSLQPKALNERVQDTNGLSQNAMWTGSFPVPHRPLSITESLLDVAAVAHTNLLAYIDPFSDRCLPARSEQSLQSIVVLANGGGFNTALERQRSIERGFAEPSPPLGHDLLTAQFINGVFIVRDELDYKKRFEQPESQFPTPFLSDSLQRGMIDPNALIHSIASLKPATWSGSIFSERYLPWCNPFAIYPFAKFLEADPETYSQIKNLSPGSKIEMGIPQIKEKPLAVFENGLSDAGLFLDIRPAAYYDPFNALDHLNREDKSKTFLIVARDETSYTFSLVLKDQPGWTANVDLWQAKLRFSKN